MTFTRSKLAKEIVVACLAGAAAGGCVMRNNPAPDVLDATPIPVDQAMERRDWAQSSVYYARTGTVAGPTGVLFDSDPHQPAWVYALSETPIFLLNILCSPYAVFRTPPWTKVEYRAATIEPTYTAMPPLPNDTEATAPAPQDENSPAPGQEKVEPPSQGAEPSSRPMDNTGNGPFPRPSEQQPPSAPAPGEGVHTVSTNPTTQPMTQPGSEMNK